LTFFHGQYRFLFNTTQNSFWGITNKKIKKMKNKRIDLLWQNSSFTAHICFIGDDTQQVIVDPFFSSTQHISFQSLHDATIFMCSSLNLDPVTHMDGWNYITSKLIVAKPKRVFVRAVHPLPHSMWDVFFNTHRRKLNIKTEMPPAVSIESVQYLNRLHFASLDTKTFLQTNVYQRLNRMNSALNNCLQRIKNERQSHKVMVFVLTENQALHRDQIRENEPNRNIEFFGEESRWRTIHALCPFDKFKSWYAKNKLPNKTAEQRWAELPNNIKQDHCDKVSFSKLFIRSLVKHTPEAEKQLVFKFIRRENTAKKTTKPKTRAPKAKTQTATPKSRPRKRRKIENDADSSQANVEETNPPQTKTDDEEVENVSQDTNEDSGGLVIEVIDEKGFVYVWQLYKGIYQQTDEDLLDSRIYESKKLRPTVNPMSKPLETWNSDMLNQFLEENNIGVLQLPFCEKISGHGFSSKNTKHLLCQFKHPINSRYSPFIWVRQNVLSKHSLFKNKVKDYLNGARDEGVFLVKNETTHQMEPQEKTNQTNNIKNE
jgi:hypothetical protein